MSPIVRRKLRRIPGLALLGGADEVTRVTGQKVASNNFIQICRSGQTVNLLDTQIGLVDAEEGMAMCRLIQRFPETVYRSMSRRSRRIVPGQSCDERFYDQRSLKSLRPLLHSVKSGRAPELKGEFRPHS
jgi:hypothetical protein